MRLNRWSVIINTVSAIVGSVIMSLQSQGATPIPGDLQLVPTNALPEQATWLSVKYWGTYPPSPFNWLAGVDNVLYYRSASYGTNFILIDDTQAPDSLGIAAVQTTDSSGPPFPGDGNSGGTNYGGGNFISPNFGPDDIWLSIANLQTGITNSQANYFLVGLHGVTNHPAAYWQLLSNSMVNVRPWGFGEIQPNPGTNDIYFNIITNDKPASFFWAAGGDNIASIASPFDAYEPNTNGSGGVNGTFTISLQYPNTNPVTIYYKQSCCTTLPGIDYSNYPGTIGSNLVGYVTIDAYAQQVTVNVQPRYDTNVDFDEPITFALILTNDYLVDRSNAVTTLILHDNNVPTNLFEVVATNLPSPVNIDYSPIQQALLLAINYSDNATNFGILHTNAILTNWCQNVQFINSGNEIRMATVKVTTNGLNAGDLLFGNGYPGGIGWISADGASSNLNWVALPGETNLIQALYVDQTGVWSNDVIAVTGPVGASAGGPLNLWRINFQTNLQIVAGIPATHLEGALTVPLDNTYGPWAGKILTGDEYSGRIYSVDTNGVVNSDTIPPFTIIPDQFLLVPPTNDLYCISYAGDISQLLKVSRDFLANYVGGIMVEQSGETNPNPTLFFLRWDTNTTCFKIHGMRLTNGEWFEKSAFAPFSMPPVQ